VLCPIHLLQQKDHTGHTGKADFFVVLLFHTFVKKTMNKLQNENAWKAIAFPSCFMHENPVKLSMGRFYLEHVNLLAWDIRSCHRN
jgi:hypothetical protein